MTAAGYRIAANVAFLITYVVLVPVLGFFTATGAYLFLHMTYLGVRPLRLSAAVVIGVLAVFYGIFETLLGVVIPHGRLF